MRKQRAITTTALGAQWENTVCRFLQRRGLRKIQGNFRCKSGEIDLIMADGKTLVFVEVRFRSTAGYARSYETISPAKQRRLHQSALHYLSTHCGSVSQSSAPPPCRFDVIGIDSKPQRNSRLPAVNFTWIKNAF